MPNGDFYEGPYKDHKRHGIGLLQSSGQTTRVEYCEGVKVREIDQNDESKQIRPEEVNKESLEQSKS